MAKEVKNNNPGKVKLNIKTFRVPVLRTEDEVTFEEVELSDRLKHTEEIETETSEDVVETAKQLKEFNERQLLMAKHDKTITEVDKKILCK
jgi:hypothetical protein